MQIERFFSSSSNTLPTLQRTVSATLCTVPEEWSADAAEAFFGAFLPTCPLNRVPVEENTLPSWLWRHQAASAERKPEAKAAHVFDRLAGSATYTGWKNGLFAEEREARTFHDEIHALFATRTFAMEPRALQRIGTFWAYGLVPEPQTESPLFETASVRLENLDPNAEPSAVDLRNTTIDGLLRDQASPLQTAWHSLLRPAETMSVRFQDTLKEWQQDKSRHASPVLALDLLRFLRADGSFDAPAFQQAVKLATLFLDLSGPDLGLDRDPARSLQIGFVNLAALLMALGYGYATQEGRIMAASLAALMTGEALQASALLATHLGPCPAYRGEAESKRRQIRNQFRAAHGERTDYERLSVLPPVLEITDRTDLVLVALARRSWELALEAIDRSGLRSLDLTATIASPEIAAFLETSGIDLLPEVSLQHDAEDEIGFSRTLNPAFRLGLQKLGLDPAEIKAVAEHAVGTRALEGTPGFSPSELAARGFDAPMLAQIRQRLMDADRLSLVFTPFVFGEEACREKLGIKDENLMTPTFDLLAALGYEADEIAFADTLLFGTGSVSDCTLLNETQKAAFAVREEIAPFAIVKMAAAVQPFVSQDLGLHLTLSNSLSAQERELLVLASWREGLWSLSLSFDAKPFATTSKKLSERTGVSSKALRGAKANLPTPRLPLDKVSKTMVQMTEPKAKATREAVSLTTKGGRKTLRSSQTKS